MAFAATVPPAVVTANRSLLAALVATNFFGQNTMAIAANEAAYAEMWAQDAAAMYGYAASASAATTLTPFREPPPTTSPAGQSAQAAAVAHAAGTATGAHTQSTLPGLTSAVPHQLHTLAAAGSSGSTAPAASLASSPVLTAVSGLNTLTGPAALGSAFLRTIGSGGDFGQELYAVILQARINAARPTSPEFRSETTPAGPGRGVVLASAGKAAPVGKLSVPHSWTTATATADSAGELARSTGTGFRALPPWAGNPSTSTPGVMPPPGTGPMTSVGHHTGKRAFLNRERRFKMPRPAVGG
jgi:PPE-repeat protein